jgi:hypothetical protein
MRKTAFVLAGIVSASFALVGCDVQKTEEGNVSLPKYDVSKTQEGDVTVPKYDVDAPKVDVTTEQKQVDVPKVGVYTEKETLTVPKVDVTPAQDRDDKTAQTTKGSPGRKRPGASSPRIIVSCVGEARILRRASYLRTFLVSSHLTTSDLTLDHTFFKKQNGYSYCSNHQSFRWQSCLQDHRN